jgi:hypothetical protein
MGSSRKEKRDSESNMQKKLREKGVSDRSHQAGSLRLVREIVDRSFRDLTREQVPMQEKCIEFTYRLCLNHRSN